MCSDRYILTDRMPGVNFSSFLNGDGWMMSEMARLMMAEKLAELVAVIHSIPITGGLGLNRASLRRI